VPGPEDRGRPALHRAEVPDQIAAPPGGDPGHRGPEVRARGRHRQGELLGEHTESLPLRGDRVDAPKPQRLAGQGTHSHIVPDGGAHQNGGGSSSTGPVEGCRFVPPAGDAGAGSTGGCQIVGAEEMGRVVRFSPPGCEVAGDVENGPVIEQVFDRSGREPLTSGKEALVLLWRVTAGRLITLGHNDDQRPSPDGRRRVG
jgi:hypothetical protein